MKTFDVQGNELNVPRSAAFAFIANAAHLPGWTNAFCSITPGRALMRTPTGEVDVELEVEALEERGTIDWRMTSPTVVWPPLSHASSRSTTAAASTASC